MKDPAYSLTNPNEGVVALRNEGVVAIRKSPIRDIESEIKMMPFGLPQLQS